MSKESRAALRKLREFYAAWVNEEAETNDLIGALADYLEALDPARAEGEMG